MPAYRRRYEVAASKPAALRPRPRVSTWTAARVGYLRQRWRSGATAATIARELGVSRDSVLSKVSYSGMRRPQPRRAHPWAGVKPPATRSGGVGLHPAPSRRPSDQPWILSVGVPAGTVPTWVRDAKPYVEDPQAGAQVPPAQRRSLLELGAAVCRWPFGDPATADFFFCGAPALAERPYCAAHCAQAFRPLTRHPRRRRRRRIARDRSNQLAAASKGEARHEDIRQRTPQE